MALKQNTTLTNDLGKIIDVNVLGKIAALRRKEMGLSQVKLAGLSGVGIRFISELENGKSTVELGKVLQVLQSLGLELTLNKKGWH